MKRGGGGKCAQEALERLLQKKKKKKKSFLQSGRSFEYIEEKKVHTKLRTHAMKER